MKCQNCGKPAHDRELIQGAYHEYAEAINQPDTTRAKNTIARERYFGIIDKACNAQGVTVNEAP